MREGVAAHRICFTGNVMIDSLLANIEAARASTAPDRLGLTKKAFVYVTLHRPCNVDSRVELSAVLTELRRIGSDMPVVFPMHPRTRKMCSQLGLQTEGDHGLRIVEPLGYHDSLCLTEAAGGLQEESTWLRTPCLTLRPNTERPITITLGSNQLTSLARLSADIDALLAKPLRFGTIPPLWDGHAAERIIASLLAAS